MRKENGTVAVPRDYFLRMAKLDYNDHTKALAREFYQNSTDAGATLIEVETDEEKRVIRVSDNGCGMGYDIIKNKLLVLGGSKKKAGDTGAFGKAKEVLFFSWEGYEVRTQDLLVKGKGADYSIETVEDWHEGTLCTIKVWQDEKFYSLVSSFKEVARKFQVFSTIKINGSEIACSMKRGELVRSEDWANVYLDKDHTSYYSETRVNGQWMFTSWLGVDEIGRIIVEIKGHSLDALTSNRDDLKGEWKAKHAKLLQEVSTNAQSALTPPKEIIREKFSGLGRVEVDRTKLAAKMKSALLQKTDAEEATDVVLDLIPSENTSGVTMERVIGIIDACKKSINKYWTYTDRFAFIGYKPDFVVAYEKGSKKNIRRSLSSRKALILAHAWTEIIKQVLLDIDMYLEFTVGFDYSQETTAAYAKVDEEYYFYLNPDLILSDLEVKNPMSNRTLLMEDLKLKAIHEVTHLFFIYHNESFLLKFDQITASTWRSASMYKKIIKEAFLTI